MNFLRYLMLLSLIVWLGGIIFFAFVLAPTVFTVLPTRHLAGTVVNRALGSLHWIGIGCGVIFLISSMLYSRSRTGSVNPLGLRHVLLGLMLALTLTSQIGVSPKLAALRNSMGDIDAVAPSDPARIQFNALHAWSTRLERRSPAAGAGRGLSDGGSVVKSCPIQAFLTLDEGILHSDSE